MQVYIIWLKRVALNTRMMAMTDLITQRFWPEAKYKKVE